MEHDIETLLGTPIRTHFFPSSDARVKGQGGAAAQMCGPAGRDRWIFYDETYIASRMESGDKKNELVWRFVLAHEVAHHVAGDTTLEGPNKEWELAADCAATNWLARMYHLKKAQLLEAFDALDFPKEHTEGYPTRGERREKVAQCYEDAIPQIPTVPEPDRGDSQPPDGPPVSETWKEGRDKLIYAQVAARQLCDRPPSSRLICCTIDVVLRRHRVKITKAFWIGQTEVTQEAYMRITGTSASAAGPNYPVTVRWDEAEAYCQAIRLRLPTEAEWEYAATHTRPVASGDLTAVAWYDENSEGSAHEVARKNPNPLGLFDMLGNLWEWVSDWYGKYEAEAQTDPAGPPEPNDRKQRVVRGGGFEAPEYVLRTSSRRYVDSKTGYSGFRCAGELIP